MQYGLVYDVSLLAGLTKQQREEPPEIFDSDLIPGRTAPQLNKQINFMSPGSGSRLGIFKPLDTTVKVVASGSPNLTEVS